MTGTPNEPETVKAWGERDYCGRLMPLAFSTETEAEIDSLKRWHLHNRGKARVVPVTITADEEG